MEDLQGKYLEPIESNKELGYRLRRQRCGPSPRQRPLLSHSLKVKRSSAYQYASCFKWTGLPNYTTLLWSLCSRTSKGYCTAESPLKQEHNRQSHYNQNQHRHPPASKYLCIFFLSSWSTKKKNLSFSFPWLEPSFEDLTPFLKTLFQLSLPRSFSPRARWRPFHSYYSSHCSQPWGSANCEAHFL